MGNRVIAILGNGIAGDQAALAAKRTDPDARVVMLSRDAYPLYSACVLADYISGEIPRSTVFIRSVEDYAKAGIELLLSRDVASWLPENRLLRFDGEELPYDRLILATGSRPFIPPIPGVNKDGVFALKTFDDAEGLRAVRGRSAVVVGAGPVGMEAAVAFRRMGWSVALVELMDRVLPRMLDAPLANSVRKQFEGMGISVFLGERVEEISGGVRVESVRTDQRTLPADVVVLVIGMRPRIELARQAGLALGPAGGIRTDAHMGAGLPGVWACGDCAESKDLICGTNGLYMLWNNAKLQGHTAGANAAGSQKRYPGSLNVTTVKLFDRAVASAGAPAADLPEGATRVLHRKDPDGELWLVLREDRLVGVQGLGNVDRLGGLTSMMLKGLNIRRTILKGPKPSAGRDTWPLHTFEKDLMRLLNGR
ncbi:MAG: NAD(P)/FAD-dependent oxidoreductase [Deltaproteobacteria bacterium]|nr:NAD(P)/FAD-dependent oxidoreductase [Deltaproteobacteria bacterium]